MNLRKKSKHLTIKMETLRTVAGGPWHRGTNRCYETYKPASCDGTCGSCEETYDPSVCGATNECTGACTAFC